MSAEDLTTAENRMTSIEAKLMSLERSTVGDGSNEAIEKALRTYQISMVQKLKGIRDAIVAEAGSSESVSNVITERDAALAENAKLKKEIERLNYRVNHLVKALNAEEAKH
jgi:ubiquinone biosynthesis protein UbiJ